MILDALVATDRGPTVPEGQEQDDVRLSPDNIAAVSSVDVVS